MKSIQLFIIEVFGQFQRKLLKFYRDRSYFEMWFIKVIQYLLVNVCMWEWIKSKWIEECEQIFCVYEQLLLAISFLGFAHIIFAHEQTKKRTKIFLSISMQSLAANLKHHLTPDGINSTIVLNTNETKTFGSVSCSMFTFILSKDFSYNCAFSYEKFSKIQTKLAAEANINFEKPKHYEKKTRRKFNLFILHNTKLLSTSFCVTFQL